MAQNRESEPHTPVLSDWVGYWVFISYFSGPNIDPDEPARPVKARPEVITTSFYLEHYGPLGIEVKRNLEDPTIFISWSSVLYVQGPPPEVREQIDQETPGPNSADDRT
jgi:hypothetical protein